MDGMLRELVPQHIDNQTKIEKMHEYLKKICDNIDNDLTIVDPFLLLSNSELYEDLLIQILTCIELKNIIIITAHFSKNLFKKIENKLSDTKIDCYITDDFHDRYWISNTSKRGFICGTSLNGLGAKISIIDIISEDDSKKILERIDSKIQSLEYKKVDI